MVPAQVERATVAHGHSTPKLAAAFATRAAAAQLVLNHFSPRYKGDASPSSLFVMSKIEEAARAWFGPAAADPDAVVAAWDLLTLPVHAKSVEEAAAAEADAERRADCSAAAAAFARGEVVRKAPSGEGAPQ